MAFENGPETTLTRELLAAGVELPEPNALPDDELTAKLWEVIRALGRMRVFLDQTDHLTDRELYTYLCREVLPQELPVLDPDPLSAWHFDVCETWSDEHTRLFLKHYADDEFRNHWLEEFPDYDMPAHEDPPYDRDRHLPEAG